jgi:hypothetical protein
MVDFLCCEVAGWIFGRQLLRSGKWGLTDWQEGITVLYMAINQTGGAMNASKEIAARLEELRTELRAERSYG